MCNRPILACLILLAITAGANAQTTSPLYDDPLPAGASARLGTQAFRTGGLIRFLAFTPDGKSLLTGGDSMVQQWDAATGKELNWAGLPNFSGLEHFWCCGLSHDGKRVHFVVGERLGVNTDRFTTSLRVWDLAAWTEIRRFPPKRNPAQKAFYHQSALSPDSDFLIEKVQGALWVLDAAGKEVKPPIGGAAKFSAHAFHPHGKQILTGDDNHTIRVFELATGNELRSFGLKGNQVSVMAISPDGQWLATVENPFAGQAAEQSGPKVRLWGLPAGKVVRELPLADKHGAMLTFSPDSRALLTVVGSYRRTVFELWDVITGQRLRSWLDTQWMIDKIAVSPDSKTLVTGSRSGILRFWNMATGVERFSHLGHLEQVNSLWFVDGGRALRSSGEDGQYLEWDVAAGRIKRRINAADERLHWFYLAPDRRLLATHEFHKHTMQVREAATAKILHTIEGHITRGFLNNGTLISQDKDQKIHLWDPVTAKRGASLDVGLERGFTMPLGKSGLVVVEKETAVWDIAAGRRLFAWNLIDKRIIERHDIGRDDEVRQVALSPDGKLIAFSVCRLPSRSEPDYRGKIVLCELHSGNILHTWPTGAEHPEALAFAPDGKTLAASAERTIQLWDVATGQERHTFRAPRGGIQALCFSDEGTTLASGGADGVIYVWDLRPTK